MLKDNPHKSKQNGSQFCTAVNCIDGRVQLPIIMYLRKRFHCEYVDSITEGGPNLILAEQSNGKTVRSILERLRISIENHNSIGIAIAGHHDCAANPAPQANQISHIQRAADFLRVQHEDLEVIGLWVDKNWTVHELTGEHESGN